MTEPLNEKRSPERHGELAHHPASQVYAELTGAPQPQPEAALCPECHDPQCNFNADGSSCRRTFPAPVEAEREWPVNRVFLPEGVIGLAAVSPELENTEGAWWVRESFTPTTDTYPVMQGDELREIEIPRASLAPAGQPASVYEITLRLAIEIVNQSLDAHDAVAKLESLITSPAMQGEGEATGEICKRCFRPVAETYPTWWSAPDDLWLQLYNTLGGIRCIPCFTKDCEERGITVYWQAVEEDDIAAAPSPAPTEDVAADAICAYHGQRLIEWMDDPNRKPANEAFTAGNERQIAYRFERAATLRPRDEAAHGEDKQ